MVGQKEIDPRATTAATTRVRRVLCAVDVCNGSIMQQLGNCWNFYGHSRPRRWNYRRKARKCAPIGQAQASSTLWENIPIAAAAG